MHIVYVSMANYSLISHNVTDNPLYILMAMQHHINIISISHITSMITTLYHHTYIPYLYIPYISLTSTSSTLNSYSNPMATYSLSIT